MLSEKLPKETELSRIEAEVRSEKVNDKPTEKGHKNVQLKELRPKEYPEKKELKSEKQMQNALENLENAELKSKERKENLTEDNTNLKGGEYAVRNLALPTQKLSL